MPRGKTETKKNPRIRERGSINFWEEEYLVSSFHLTLPSQMKWFEEVSIDGLLQKYWNENTKKYWNEYKLKATTFQSDKWAQHQKRKDDKFESENWA